MEAGEGPVDGMAIAAMIAGAAQLGAVYAPAATYGGASVSAADGGAPTIGFAFILVGAMVVGALLRRRWPALGGLVAGAGLVGFGWNMIGAVATWIGADVSGGDIGLGPGAALLVVAGASGMLLAVWSLLDTALGHRVLYRLAVTGGLAGAAALVGVFTPPADVGAAWHELVFASRDDFAGAARAGTYVTMYNVTMGAFIACLLVVLVAGLASGRPFGVWLAIGGGGPVVWTVFCSAADIGGFGLLGGGADIRIDVHPFTPFTSFVFTLVVIAALVQITRADPLIAPAWMVDPTGRHQFRYWNGRTWTSTVADQGVMATDQLPIVVPAAVGVPPPPAG